MLADHVGHHMRARLAPMLYDETDHEAAAAMRASIVAKAERSDAAKRKQTTGRTDDGLPVHSFQSLLADLATYCRIKATTALNEKYVLTLACARPVVAFDVGGMADAVRDGETGFCVPLGDCAAFAQALATLASNASLRARMGAAGRELILREFDRRLEAERFHDLYRGLLA